MDAQTTTTAAELDAAFCEKEGRTVGKTHCVNWRGRILQLKPERG